MGIFSGLFRSRDKPKDSLNGSNYAFFMGGSTAGNLATKGDSITFSTPTIEGTIYRRNKLDGQNKHPWKAEVNENDTSVPASVISGWFTEVYEPDYAEVG